MSFDDCAHVEMQGSEVHPAPGWGWGKACRLLGLTIGWPNVWLIFHWRSPNARSKPTSLDSPVWCLEQQCKHGTKRSWGFTPRRLQAFRILYSAYLVFLLSSSTMVLFFLLQILWFLNRLQWEQIFNYVEGIPMSWSPHHCILFCDLWSL